MATLTIERLHDEVIEELGDAVDSLYAEMFWLPVIGPTALWLLRHVARHTGDGPYVVDSEVLGKCLGVGGDGRHAPLHKSLQRLNMFHVARHVGDDHWFLPSHLPPLRAPQLRRLPDVLQERHQALEAVTS